MSRPETLRPETLHHDCRHRHHRGPSEGHVLHVLLTFLFLANFGKLDPLYNEANHKEEPYT